MRVARDGADMQTDDKAMPTRLPMEGGTKINMYFGDTLITVPLSEIAALNGSYDVRIELAE